jgi:hypothetical protein
MFLDLACFLGGLKISMICRTWSRDYSHPKFRLKILQDRSLIEEAKGGILYIHDQLRDMGRKITTDSPIVNRFVWNSNQSNFFSQKDEVVILLFQSFNFISIYYDFFLMSKTKCFNFQF